MNRLKFDGSDTGEERRRVLASLALRHEELLQKLAEEQEIQATQLQLQVKPPISSLMADAGISYVIRGMQSLAVPFDDLPPKQKEIPKETLAEKVMPVIYKTKLIADKHIRKATQTGKKVWKKVVNWYEED